MKTFKLLLAALSLVGCASYFQRKTCESTNWFDYGQRVALEGRRLTGDQFISECNNAEANVGESALDRGFKSGLEKYCQPETAYQNGKNGNFFSTEMCTGQGLSLLTAKHSLGVIDYCQKTNGFSAGAKGKPYNKICPADLERSFMPEFNRGRKRFIETNIDENQKTITRLDHEISSLQSELRFKASELQRYQYISAKDEKLLQRLNELNRERQNLEHSIRSKQSEQSGLENKNREYKLELIKIE